MKQNKIIPVVILLIIAAFVLPWRRIEWGKMVWQQERTIVVSGQARDSQSNQIASFSAGVMVANDNKEEAVKEVNSKVEEIIKTLKDFGIADKDIQTQSVSIFQEENRVEKETGVYRSQPGQWRVSNTVEVTLREIERASELTDLLTQSGATNVYGPNFRVDDTSQMELDLVTKAVEDARVKAEKMAEASGSKLGRVISVTEGGGGGVGPVYRAMEGMGGGAPLEPGSSNVYKTVTVVWEIK